MSARRPLAAIACAISAAACGPSAELSRIPSPGPIQGAFYVSSEFAPSGHMGDGQNAGHVTAHIGEDCFARAHELGPRQRPPGAGGDCYRFDYAPGEQLWAGVYWVYPSNNWGTRPGRTLVGSYTHVRFWAAAEARPDSLDPSGALGLKTTFIAGGISDASPDRFKDAFRAQTTKQLTPEWQAFTLELMGQPTDSVIGAFAWVTNYPAGAEPKAQAPSVLYIDDVVWE